MLTYKQLLVLLIAILLSVHTIQSEAGEADTNPSDWDKTEQENSRSSGNPTDESILGQSPWTNFAHKFGSEVFPIGSPVDPMGLFFPTLFTFSSLSGRNWNPNFFVDPTLLSSTADSTNTDTIPAASNVLLLLADDKPSRNVKRSPIFPQEILRQARQTDFPGMLSQVLSQFNQGMNTMLGQSQDDSANPDINSFLSQARSALGPLGQWIQNATGQVPDASDDPSRSILGQALNTPFNLDSFMSSLNQMMGGESQISEVRVRPDAEAHTEEQLTAHKLQEMKLNMLMLKALSDKKLPILWFRDVHQKPANANVKKTADEIMLEQKLFAFERQVIKELRLLQEIERQAREMQTASNGMHAKVSKGSDYKLRYALNEKPVHKITLEDIEKALADEYVLKMLLQKTQMQDAGKPTKRNSYPAFNKEEAAEILAYALRNAAAIKTNEANSRKQPMDELHQQQQQQQQQFENKAATMDMRNSADRQSIDQMQKNWMQSQYQDAQAAWQQERMQTPQQEKAYYQQNPEFVGGQQTEQALENEDMNEFERKKGFKGFGFNNDNPVYHYHYYLPTRNDYNSGSYNSKPAYSSSYNSQPSYSSSSYSSGQSYSSQPSYQSAGGYRTATGDEEIHQMLQTDPAWSELKGATQQQEQQLTHERKTRLASNVRYWLVLGKENKGNRQKRQVGVPSLQPIDETALNELRATYGKELKEITLLPHEDPAEALMRYNTAAFQELMVDEQDQPVEMDSESALKNPLEKERYVATRAQPVFMPQMSNVGSLTAIDASALFDSRNITESLLSSVLEEVNRRLTSCCTKCKDSILADIKEKLERNEKLEESDKQAQYFEDWMRYMSSKGYDKNRLTKVQYDNFLRNNKLSHFDIKLTNNIKRETSFAKVTLSPESTNGSNETTDKYLRRHTTKHIVVDGTDIVNANNKDVAQDSQQADGIVATTMKPRKRLRLKKNRKNVILNDNNTTTSYVASTTTPTTTTTTTEVTTLPPTN